MSAPSTETTCATAPAEVQQRLADSFRLLCPNMPGVNRVESGKDPGELLSPLTNLPLPRPRFGVAEDMEQACLRARRAQVSWQARGVHERCQILRKAASLVWARREQLLDVVQWETGKSRVDAHEELLDQILTLRYVSKMTASAIAPQRRQGVIPFVTKVVEYAHPVGVVGVISPWNYPLALATSDAFAALAAGNSVVLKPDSLTPLTALAMRSLLNDCGLPADVFQVVCGSGRELGPSLIAGSQYLMFTGSSATGATLAAQCGQHLIGYSAELGGKNPLLVLPGTNLEKTARSVVRACFANTGQLCVSIERIYISEDEKQPFLRALAREVEALRVGADLDWETQMGVLISRDHLQKVDAQVKDAVAKGASVLCGGHPCPQVAATAYAPTILLDVPPSAHLYREETFGPVASVYTYRNIEDAIRQANDSDYGLNCSIWGDAHLAQQVATRIRTGTVNINDGYAPAWASMDAPMGGMGISGIGRRHGIGGIRKYTQAQSVVTQRIMPIMVPPGVKGSTYAAFTGWTMRLLSFVPGIR